MKKGDFFFVLVILIVIIAMILLVLNIHALFPTPAPQQFVQSVVPQG